jgi:hypothetical protein
MAPTAAELEFGEANRSLTEDLRPDLLQKRHDLSARIAEWDRAIPRTRGRTSRSSPGSGRFAALPSIAGAALAFAVRHYSQVLLAWPHVDWASATIWVAATFVAGLIFGWLYEKSTSLWPSILCHYVLNLLA